MPTELGGKEFPDFVRVLADGDRFKWERVDDGAVSDSRGDFESPDAAAEDAAKTFTARDEWLSIFVDADGDDVADELDVSRG